MDREAWQATDHGLEKIQTPLQLMFIEHGAEL